MLDSGSVAIQSVPDRQRTSNHNTLLRTYLLRASVPDRQRTSNHNNAPASPLESGVSQIVKEHQITTPASIEASNRLVSQIVKEHQITTLGPLPRYDGKCPRSSKNIKSQPFQRSFNRRPKCPRSSKNIKSQLAAAVVLPAASVPDRQRTSNHNG